MMNYRIILFIVLIGISDVYLSATGYYRQQHEYQKSEESYINGELQHKSKDGEFYAKQGEIASETQKPPIKHHFKHHEEYNKDDHLNQQSSHHNQQSLAASGLSQDYIRHDNSRFSNAKELKHEGYVDRYNTHGGNFYQKNPEPYLAVNQQKTVEDHSKFLSGQNSHQYLNQKQFEDFSNKNSHLHNSNHFEKFGSTDNKNIKDLTSQCYEAWKMYSLEEMNRNLEEYRSKNTLNSRPLNLQFTAQQPVHSDGIGLGLHGSHGQHSYNYASHESGHYGSSRSSAFAQSDHDIEDVDLSSETKIEKPGFWKKLHL